MERMERSLKRVPDKLDKDHGQRITRSHWQMLQFTILKIVLSSKYNIIKYLCTSILKNCGCSTISKPTLRAKLLYNLASWLEP